MHSLPARAAYNAATAVGYRSTDELPVAAVLIYRFWQERRNAKRVIGAGSRRGAVSDVARKTRQRLQ